MLKVELERENRELRARVVQLQEQVAVLTAKPEVGFETVKLRAPTTLVAWHLAGRPRPEVTLESGITVNVWQHDGLFTAWVEAGGMVYSITKHGDGKLVSCGQGVNHAALLLSLR